jgi:hypothetical protein
MQVFLKEGIGWWVLGAVVLEGASKEPGDLSTRDRRKDKMLQVGVAAPGWGCCSRRAQV